MEIKLFGGNRVANFDAKQAIHQWNLHHNRKAIFMEACRRRDMPENRGVEEALEAAVDGQADDADEAVVARNLILPVIKLLK